jgi:cytochrome b561
MSTHLHYGTTAKVFHWLIVALLAVQFPIGWLMPDVHRGPPGTPMTFHISFGILILLLTAGRLVWRLGYPVAPESSLPGWQRISSEVLHWMLYVMVLATTLSGWLFASFRGWSVSFFYLLPLPMLVTANPAGIKAIDGLHQAAEWTLLALVGFHIAAALAHIFVYRDQVMNRMLPNSRQRGYARAARPSR